jgi:hypothetical protein
MLVHYSPERTQQFSHTKLFDLQRKSGDFRYTKLQIALIDEHLLRRRQIGVFQLADRPE